MKANRIGHHLSQIVKSYGRLVKNTGTLFIVSAIVCLSGVAITYPLWYLATSHRRAYSIFTLLLCAGGLLLAVVRRTIRIERSFGSPKEYMKQALIPAVGKLLKFVGLLVAFMAIVALFAAELYFISIPGTLVFLLLAGLLMNRKTR